jgi:hypothetical protein
MKRALKTAAFLILLAGAYWYVDGILKIKNYFGEDESNQLPYYYKRKKQDIDVFFVGSSHVFWDIDPVTIWKEAGIPSYILGSNSQPFWNSYFYIKEGLKYQTPKVIVLDVYAASFGPENNASDSNWAHILRNNMPLKPSKEKIESIFVSSPDRRIDIFLGFPVYHVRYNELTKRDFVDPYEGGATFRNGYHLDNNVNPQARPDVTNVTATRELPPKQMEYLLKIIELTKNQYIKLLLVKSPFVLSPKEQEYFNSVARIAESNDLRFINYNLLYDELDFDFTTDMADKWHLSYPGGVVKYSRHLAEVLAVEYGLPNRLHDPAYEDWNIWAERIGGDTENTESL